MSTHYQVVIAGEGIQQRITKLQPEQNALTLDNGERISYDYLIVAVGIQLNWHKILPGKA